MTTVAVLSLHRHPRLRYVLRELSRDLGYKFRLYTDPEKWKEAGAEARIAYGTSRPGNKVLQLPAHGFLSGKAPAPPDLAVEWVKHTPYFFKTRSGDYDRLAVIFYCLSRYEEYEAFTPDKHGRFPAAESHAGRNDYLQQPVVRIYARQLAAMLQRHFPNLPPPKARSFHLQPTYDIDLLWAYRHRGWKGAASGLRDIATGQVTRARERFLTGRGDDPYYNIGYLLDLHPEVTPYIFWLLADNEAREDINPFPVPDEQISLMRELEQAAVHGIHPGYRSVETEGKLQRETARYRKVFGKSPVHSRQHFLRLRFPDTYRALRLRGITNDHTMGYGDATGWRAGTNLPFYWYDLRQEAMTGLLVHSFAVMDVTLKNYLGLGPDKAKRELRALQNTLRPYGGPFTTLWHNSSFADEFGWRGWREVYESLWHS